MSVSLYEVPINIIKDVEVKDGCPMTALIAIFDNIEHLELCGFKYDYAFHIDWLVNYPELDKYLSIESGNRLCDSCNTLSETYAEKEEIEKQRRKNVESTI